MTSIGIPFSRVECLTSLGIQIDILTGDETHLCQSIDEQLPPIVVIRTGELSNWKRDVQHAVVVSGYDDEFFYIHDPATLPSSQKVSIGEFLLAWDEFDYRYIMVRP